MTDAAPAAPAVKTYTEEDVTALMKEKLAAEAKAASLVDKLNATQREVEDTRVERNAANNVVAKMRAEIDLLKKELELMKKKYIENEPASW